jgi:hypothetical protein
MTIHVRNLRTNETLTLATDHPVLVVGLSHKDFGDYPAGEKVASVGSREFVSAQAWASEWSDRHAYVMTDAPAKAWCSEPDDPKEYRVWVRCSLRLL